MSKPRFSMLPIKRTGHLSGGLPSSLRILNSGQFQIGDKLPSERELSESFSVSRSSIRQALKVLEAAGRIETRVGSGTYFVEKQAVASSGDNLNALLALGVSKEFMQQLIAARNRDRAGDLRRPMPSRPTKRDPRAEKADRRECPGQDGQRRIRRERRPGHELEAKVAELAGNPILSAMQRQIHQLWIQAWRVYGFVPESRHTLHQEHCAIIEALASKKNTPRVIDPWWSSTWTRKSSKAAWRRRRCQRAGRAFRSPISSCMSWWA